MFIASIFSSDITMISYFNTTVNIIILTDQTFNRVLEIFIILFGHYKFFIKFYFYFTTVLIFFDHIINKIVNSILTYVWLKRLTYHRHILIWSHNCKQYVFIFIRLRLNWIFFPINSGNNILSKSTKIINYDFVFLSWFSNLMYLLFLDILNK